MIAALRGVLFRPDLASQTDTPTAWDVEIETPSGVTYRVQVPRSVWDRLPASGESVALRIHEVRREDAHLLYGFLTRWDAALFALLLTASGVGPRLALAMLSTLSTGLLVRALQQRDLATLSQVPGVGKKMAERIGVALSERIEDLASRAAGAGAGADGWGAGGALGPDAASGADDDPALAALAAVRALQGLGLRLDEADALVQRTLAETPGLAPDELVRRALAAAR
jgi:holliday junction DNA helicase RuvA